MLVVAMVADAVHILLGLALVALLYRSRSVGPYLVAVIGASFPDVDVFLFHLLLPELTGPAWSHRGITHSIFAAVAFTALAGVVDARGPAAVGYLSHVAFDFVTGGVRLFAPFGAELYGTSLGWYATNGVVSAFSLVGILATVVALDTDVELAWPAGDPSEGSGDSV